MTAHARASSAIVACAWLATGCASGPAHPEHAALLQAPALGLVPTAEPAPSIDPQWWQAYGDPTLDRLVDRALRDSPRLGDALARLRAAEAATTVAGGALRPRIDADASEQRSHLSARSFYPAPYGGGTYWDGDIDLAVSWHLDFWGRQHDRLAAANHDARAATIGIRGARLAIETSVVSTYLELDRAHALLDLAHTIAVDREQLATIATARSLAGLDTDIDSRAARAAADDARADEREAAVRVELAVHRLAALTGQGPSAYESLHRPRLAEAAAPDLPTSIPANLLLRRGDVAIALERVHSLGALEHAARAASYPDVNLRAFAGLTAFGLRELLSAPARTMGGSAAVRLPLYDAGQLRGELHIANAAVDLAIADYNETVLRAVREAADQLATIAAIRAEIDDAQARLEALDRAARLANERRDAGLTSSAPALEAQLRVLAVQRAMVSLQTARQLARVALVAALGGSDRDPPPPTPTASAGAP